VIQPAGCDGVGRDDAFERLEPPIDFPEGDLHGAQTIHTAADVAGIAVAVAHQGRGFAAVRETDRADQTS